jgi:Glu-tRNA(Gln) amidotransferase subunit E-like FAD-binding protein
MPGGARMYPETDLGLIKPELKGIKPPKMLSELAKELETKHKLSQDLAKLTVRSLQVEFIMGLIERFGNVKPGFIAETVLSAERVIKKEFNKELKISETVYEKIFGLLNSGKISKDVVIELLSKTDKKAVEELAKDYAGVDQKNLEEEVKIAVMNNNGASFNALMGIIMGRFKGKASGSQVSELLKKYMK